MAKCDEGYICNVCGKDVESITDSDLYLRFVLGKVDPEVLHTTPERHIRCNPVLAQFIDDERFEPVQVEGEMSLQSLDTDFVSQRKILVTRGYRRLWELKCADGVSILDFPLEEFRQTSGDALRPVKQGHAAENPEANPRIRLPVQGRFHTNPVQSNAVRFHLAGSA